MPVALLNLHINTATDGLLPILIRATQARQGTQGYTAGGHTVATQPRVTTPYAALLEQGGSVLAARYTRPTPAGEPGLALTTGCPHHNQPLPGQGSSLKVTSKSAGLCQSRPHSCTTEMTEQKHLTHSGTCTQCHQGQKGHSYSL